MGRGGGSQQWRRLNWVAMKVTILEEMWSWKELGFENKNICMHLFAVLKEQIKNQVYLYLQVGGPPQNHAHSGDLGFFFFLWQGFFWPCHLYHPLSREQAETMHESQKVFWKVFCFNKYMLIKEDSFIWKIPAVTCEISVTMTPLSLPISSTARSRSLPSS